MIDGWTLDELNARGLVAEPGDAPKKVVSIDAHPSWTSDATGYRGSDEATAGADVVIRDSKLVKSRFSDFFPKEYRTLDTRFLEAMEEIGLYGLEKYGDASFDSQRKTGTLARMKRTETEEIELHMAIHFAEYAEGVKHDKFGTLRHQLAAAAFNAMMEYVYAVEADKREL